MNKSQTLKMVNERIDTLIIEGQIGTEEYKRLIALHAVLTK